LPRQLGATPSRNKSASCVLSKQKLLCAIFRDSCGVRAGELDFQWRFSFASSGSQPQRASESVLVLSKLWSAVGGEVLVGNRTEHDHLLT
jgi:hypothetical protein